MYEVPRRLSFTDQVHSINTFNAINGSVAGIELLLVEQARHLRWEHGMKVAEIQARLGQTRRWVITHTKREQSA